MASAMAGWALVPLRGFLGVTFVFAGLQKLANPGFFDASNPTSIQAQLASAARVSPIHAVVGHLEHVAVPLGVVIALAELAIGAATLVGLWTRVAAAGGMLLSLGLFLTISFHASPYYTGSDIVFVFAWTPLLLAGAGGVLSADAVLTDIARARSGAGPGTLVPISFAVVQRVCGSYADGACRARAGAPCQPAPCPFLAQSPVAARPPGQSAIDRRTFTLQGGFAAALAAVALAGAGLAAGVGRLVSGKSSQSGSSPVNTVTPGPARPGPTASTTAPGSGPSGPSTPTTPATQPAGTAIGAASSVPVGGAASFQDPKSGDPGFVVQPKSGSFVAFSAVCPHQGCIVGYSSADQKFVCPCHGSQFNGQTGAVEQGPAATGLMRIRVKEGPDGQLFVT
jgi:thiosulfate dehydrogenase (quinone) large subunit